MAVSDNTLTATIELHLDEVALPSAVASVSSPGRAAVEAPLGLAPIVVGSSPECDLWADDPTVSRQHCRLTLGPNGVLLRDLGSKNGTVVNGVRIIEARIGPGAVVHLGASALTLRVEAGSQRLPLLPRDRFGEAVGASLPMRALFAQLERAAQADASVLLLGESGTGKELLAHAVHRASPRRDGPFVVVDCGALTGSLVEAELFGHEKGAFTGADSARAGLLEQADGGTVFLDEIGEMPLELQPKLLRALETRKVRRLGGSTLRNADARPVAATHRNLKQAVKEGRFREDLYYRLAVLELRVPPLRERKEDIPLLCRSLLERQRPPRFLEDLPPGALDLLQAHDWPGNVRELRNALTRLAVLRELGGAPSTSAATAAPAPADAAAPERRTFRQAREEVLEQFERDFVAAALREHRGNVSAAARAMDVSRQFLHKLIARYGLRGDDG